MEDADRGPKISPEIYVYATNKNFLNVYDALRIDKVKLEIAGYDQATSRQTGHASAWLDKDDARLLSHLVAHRLFAQVTGGKWEKFGGSQREDGSLESRTLVVEWDEGDGGRFARFPYRLTIANGPGKKTQTGGVSPAGEPTARLSMRMPEADTIKLMLALGDYIRAYETAHHHRLVAQRVRDLRDKLAERAQRHDNGTAQPVPVPLAPTERERTPMRASTAGTASTTSTRAGNLNNLPDRKAATVSSSSARPALTSIPGGNREASHLALVKPARVG